MPLMVSTKKDWFSAPLLNLSSSRLRITGVNNTDIKTYKGIETTTIKVSQALYHSMTPKNTNENSKSSTTVMALPVKKERMFSSSRTRATESPTLLAWKYASGSPNKCLNKRAPNSTSILLLVCANTQDRIPVNTASKIVAQIKPMAITLRVLSAWLTSTLSITT